MGTIDLSTATGFAQATSSFGSGIVSLFTGGQQSQWVLDEGTYQSALNPANKVIFHIFRTQAGYNGALDHITDRGGRRNAKFEFPLLDGMLTSDMGRRAETFDINILLFGGSYFQAFTLLMNILNEPTPGTLTHPVRGKIICKMDEYEILHEEKSRNAIAVRLTMIESVLNQNVFQSRQNNSAPSKLSGLTSTFTNITNAIANVQGAIGFAQTVKNTIIQGYQAMQSAYAALAAQMNSTFNPGGNIPALLPTTVGGLQGSAGAIVTTATTTALSPADPFANLPANLVSTPLAQALAISQIQTSTQAVRQQIAAQISLVENSGNGQGALTFYNDIINMRQAANDLQAAFDAGQQSSQVQLVQYTTPRLMSVREVAFANGLSPDAGDQIAFLNPELDSLNYIPTGTALTIAVATPVASG